MDIKPILFSTPMVQAIMDGRKSMTRRVDEPLTLNYPMHAYLGEPPEAWMERWHHRAKYQVGDTLWVRQTWARISDYATPDTLVGLPDGFLYKASGEYHMGLKWRPSIFMPKEACRLFLRVTDVRAERLQEITPKDAWNEGCRIGTSFPFDEHIPELKQIGVDILFKPLWDSLNAKRGYGWDTNPWVFVYTFERCDKPEGWC